MKYFPALLLTLMLSGCNSYPRPVPTPDDGKKPPTPAVKAITPGELFAALADVVETSADAMQSDELVWIVRQEKTLGRLTQADVDRFNAAFPDVAAKNRALTKDDASKLKGLK